MLVEWQQDVLNRVEWFRYGTCLPPTCMYLRVHFVQDATHIHSHTHTHIRVYTPSFIWSRYAHKHIDLLPISLLLNVEVEEFVVKVTAPMKLVEASSCALFMKLIFG